jgi:DNA-binding transcriptional MocR family regulator
MSAPSLISFARGAPSLDIVDSQGLAAAAERALAGDPAGAFSYGTADGYGPLRDWIAERHGVAPDRVVVTNGSMQAAAFLFDAIVDPGDPVVVERPTYDRTLLSLLERAAEVHAVPVGRDGLDVDELDRQLDAGLQPRLAHVIPNFQNPAGCTLSADKRARLLTLAAQHGFTIFEDDPYEALRFEGDPLPSMLSADDERVVYASSFSKTICPGIRVGYLIGPPDVIVEVRRRATNTYISPSMVAQAIVNEFCRCGAIERSIATVRTALRERAAALAEALREAFPEARFTPPEGGYFMWVELPEGTDVERLFEAAAARGVSFVKGSDFVLDGARNALRLAYSGVAPEQIREGVGRLAEAAREVEATAASPAAQAAERAG